MRLFVALEIPTHLREELARRAKALTRDLPKARWVRPEAMHLTLSFLGDTDPSRLPGLERELAQAAAPCAPIELALATVGAFPPRGRARVLWAGLVDARTQGSAEVLQELRQAVATAVERAAGVPPETRPFHPHVTLARLNPPWGKGTVERFQSAFGEPPGDVFTVRRVVLFESELLPSGARYRAVQSHDLGGRLQENQELRPGQEGRPERRQEDPA